MCASGLNDVTAPLALAAGARGVGIGSMINKLPNSQQVVYKLSTHLAVYSLKHLMPMPLFNHINLDELGRSCRV